MDAPWQIADDVGNGIDDFAEFNFLGGEIDVLRGTYNKQCEYGHFRMSIAPSLDANVDLPSDFDLSHPFDNLDNMARGVYLEEVGGDLKMNYTSQLPSGVQYQLYLNTNVSQVYDEEYRAYAYRGPEYLNGPGHIRYTVEAGAKLHVTEIYSGRMQLEAHAGIRTVIDGDDMQNNFMFEMGAKW